MRKLTMATLIILFVSFSAYAQTNKVLRLDGDGDYVDVGSNINLANKSFTIAVWAKRERIDIQEWIITQGQCSYNSGLRLGFRWNNVFAFVFYSNDVNTPAYSDIDWHYWVGTYDANTRERKVYRDGQVVVSDIASGNYHGSGKLLIGKRMEGPQNFDFRGKIDEVSIWNRTLGQEQIQSIMNTTLTGNEEGLIAYWNFDDGTAKDFSQSGNNGILHGNAHIVESDLQLGPTVKSILPNYGSVCGGASVIIKGCNFQENATISIEDSELLDVAVFPEVSASVKSQSIDITDVAPNNVTLSIIIKGKNNPEVNGTITFPTDSGVISNIFVLKTVIETSIANNSSLAGKLTVEVEGKNSAVNVTFITVDKGTGVQLSIEQTSGSDVLFPILTTDEGHSKIIGETSPGTVGLHDVIVANPDGTSDTLAHSFAYMPLVGDTSGEGSITAYDASLILQYCVGLIDQLPANISSVGGNITPRNRTISIPNVSVKTNELISVPIIIDETDDLVGGGITIKYDPSVLRATGVKVTPDSLLNRSFWQSNINNDEIRFAFTKNYLNELNRSKTVAMLEFEAISSVEGITTDLVIEHAQIAESLSIAKVDGHITFLPSKTALLQNYPNPFNPETWIPFKLSDDAKVIVSIYDVQGQLLRKLELGKIPAGVYVSKDKAVYWDGRNSYGEKVSSGIYYYTLQAGEYRATKRMLILK